MAGGSYRNPARMRTSNSSNVCVDGLRILFLNDPKNVKELNLAIAVGIPQFPAI